MSASGAVTQVIQLLVWRTDVTTFGMRVVSPTGGRSRVTYDPADHYERLAKNYDDTWSHRPDYVAWMNQRVFDRLRIEPGDRVADIGAGTGLFLRALVRHVTGDNPIVCIDPSRSMLNQLPDDPRLHPGVRVRRGGRRPTRCRPS